MTHDNSLISLDAMRANATAAVAMLKVLGNVDRLMLLCHMTEQARTVCELEQLTGISQPTLSQQLAVLRREGIVSTERQGKYIYYRLLDQRALSLMQQVHLLFCPKGEQP